MLPKKYFTAFTKSEISRLHGGPKHNFRYFVGISPSLESDVFTEVVYAKLRNQMATQKSSSRPEGFEPFQTSYGTAEFCIASSSISVPRLVLAAPRGTTPRIYIKCWERLPACILNAASSTDRFELLRREAADFE